MNLLAIDPGTRGNTGWALFIEDKLTDCGLGDPDEFQPYRMLAIEKPRFYPGDSPKLANDLITLAVQVGRYLDRYGRAVSSVGARVSIVHEPRDWKGSVPKDIHNTRVLRSLGYYEEEMFRLKAFGKTLENNVIDAIGIGMFTLGRTTKAGVRSSAP